VRHRDRFDDWLDEAADDLAQRGEPTITVETARLRELILELRRARLVHELFIRARQEQQAEEHWPHSARPCSPLIQGPLQLRVAQLGIDAARLQLLVPQHPRRQLHARRLPVDPRPRLGLRFAMQRHGERLHLRFSRPSRQHSDQSRTGGPTSRTPRVRAVTRRTDPVRATLLGALCLMLFPPGESVPGRPSAGLRCRRWER